MTTKTTPSVKFYTTDKFDALKAKVAANIERRNKAQKDEVIKRMPVVARLVEYVDAVKNIIKTIHNVYDNIDVERFPDRLPIAAMAAIPGIASFSGCDMYIRTGQISITFDVKGHHWTIKMTRADDCTHPIKLWNLMEGYSDEIRHISDAEAQWINQLADAMPAYISGVYDNLAAMVEDYV